MTSQVVCTAAVLGLATAGVDETVVRLVADPSARGNLVTLSFQGAAGKMTLAVEVAHSSRGHVCQSLASDRQLTSRG